MKQHPPSPKAKMGILDKLARRVMRQRLADIRGGEITLRDADQTSRLGQALDLSVVCDVRRPRFFRQSVLGGTLSIAQSYVDGDWDCDDLTSLFRIFVRNIQTTNRLDASLSRLAAIGHRVFHWGRHNSRLGSRRNISDHYDLGNDFFRLWLDESLAYSSGIFLTPHSTLKDASLEKFDRICRKLDLKANDHVLEIGGGWGGFAIHAARHYHCHVTTTTISNDQYVVAKERIENAHLSHRITLLKQDYRDLTGQFDKLVSVEMVEAVGHQYLDRYFRKCSGLLHSEGSLLLQAIVMPESRHREYLRSVDFIQRYIFPGGCLPSVTSLMESLGRTSDLRLVHLEEFAPHYAETLRHWRRAFHEQRSDVRELGYSEEFIRLWNYYLCYCEALFEERHISVMQLQFDKQQCRQDPIHVSRRAAAKRHAPLTKSMTTNVEEFSESHRNGR